MNTKIFVNIAVNDLKKSMDFFGKLGFSFNPQFTDEKAACMILSEEGFVMLLSEPFFKTFFNKEMVNAKKSTEVLLAISAGSRGKVDEMVDKALAMGASKLREAEDQGFMYTRSFNDLDGHIWEVIWMDIDHVNK